jgi:hypothetical protein
METGQTRRPVVDDPVQEVRARSPAAPRCVEL